MSEISTSIEMVKLGYAVNDPSDNDRCLHFTVGFDSVDGAKEAVKEIDQYNSFDHKIVNEAIDKIVATNVAPFGNPGFSVGRESSPCIYVNKLDNREKDKIEKVKNILKNAKASEVDEVNDGAGSSFGATVRAWWD